MTDGIAAVLALAKKLKFISYALAALGLFLLVVAPAITRGQATSRASQVSMGGSSAGAAFEGVLRGEQYSRGEETVKSERSMGVLLLIAGAIVLGVARSDVALRAIIKVSAPPSGGPSS